MILIESIQDVWDMSASILPCDKLYISKYSDSNLCIKKIEWRRFQIQFCKEHQNKQLKNILLSIF